MIESLFGYPLREKWTHTGWWEERIHPEDREQVLASINTALRSGKQVKTDLPEDVEHLVHDLHEEARLYLGMMAPSRNRSSFSCSSVT